MKSHLICTSRVLNTTSAVGLDKQISSDFNRRALVYFPYKFVLYRPCSLHSSVDLQSKYETNLYGK